MTSESLLAVACPNCHAALAVSVDLVGAAAQCPLCAKGFLVPTAQPQAQAPAGPRTGLDAVVPDLPPVGQPVDKGMQFAEPVKTIVTEDGVVELRRLTPEERAARRARRNLIMLLFGVGLLLTIVLIFGTKHR